MVLMLLPHLPPSTSARFVRSGSTLSIRSCRRTSAFSILSVSKYRLQRQPPKKIEKVYWEKAYCDLPLFWKESCGLLFEQNKTLWLRFFASCQSCPHFPVVHVAHIQGCGDVQHEALEAETEKEEHHGEDDVPQLTAGDMAWFSLCWNSWNHAFSHQILKPTQWPGSHGPSQDGSLGRQVMASYDDDDEWMDEWWLMNTMIKW